MLQFTVLLLFFARATLGARTQLEFHNQLLSIGFDNGTRCYEKLMSEFIHTLEYRQRGRSSFKKIENHCPSTPPQKSQFEIAGPKGVVFAFMMHNNARFVINIVEQIMAFNPLHKFIFHVDLSSPEIVHKRIEEFCINNPFRTYTVDPPVDVEWGGIGFTEAQMLIFHAAVDLWEFNNIMFLSGADILIANQEYFESFWERNRELNYNGYKKDFKEKLWVFMLNDLISSCDKVAVSFGQRDEHINAASLFDRDLRFEQTNTHVVYSYDFALWVTSGSDPNIESLQDILKYVSSVDEVLFQTVFKLSPYCHDLIRLNHGRELMLYAWPSEGKRKVHFQDFEWYTAKSPYLFDNNDIPRIAMYDKTLFARKVSQSKKSRKLIQTVKNWVQGKARRPRLEWRFEFKLESGGLCLAYIGSLQTDWVDCKWETTHLEAFCIEKLCQIKPKTSPNVFLASHSSKAEPGVMVLFGPPDSYLETRVWNFEDDKVRLGQKDANKRHRNGLCMVKPDTYGVFHDCKYLHESKKVNIIHLSDKTEL